MRLQFALVMPACTGTETVFGCSLISVFVSQHGAQVRRGASEGDGG